MNRQIGDRAVVLGASLAGLLAARVLTDAYAQVTVIDRDQLPEAGTHRRAGGVSAAPHLERGTRPSHTAGSATWRAWWMCRGTSRSAATWSSPASRAVARRTRSWQPR